MLIVHEALWQPANPCGLSQGGRRCNGPDILFCACAGRRASHLPIHLHTACPPWRPPAGLNYTISVQDKERLWRQLKLQAEKEEKEKLREEAKRAKEEARKKREEEKELKEKERREKREKDEKEKAEKQRRKEERRKERQEALECVPRPLLLGSHTLCPVLLSPPPPPTGISACLGQPVSLRVMSHRAKLEEKRKKEEEKRLREEEKVECVSRSHTFPYV